MEAGGDTVQHLGAILKNRIEQGALKRLVERGLVQIAGLTPSDASHMLFRVDVWDRDAAQKALLLFGRRRTGSGNMLSNEPNVVAQMIVESVDLSNWFSPVRDCFC